MNNTVRANLLTAIAELGQKYGGLHCQRTQGSHHLHARGTFGGKAMNDPIVDEVRRARDAYAAGFNYDLHAIFLDIKKRERERGLHFVDGVARQPFTNEAPPPSGVAMPAPRDIKPFPAAELQGRPAQG
jgi:hypothetical protein